MQWILESAGKFPLGVARCISSDEWTNKRHYTHAVKHYLVLKKNEALPHTRMHFKTRCEQKEPITKDHISHGFA